MKYTYLMPEQTKGIYHRDDEDNADGIKEYYLSIMKIWPELMC